ncbi:MAG: MFS transporter [Hyphomicrobiales bacterium]
MTQMAPAHRAAEVAPRGSITLWFSLGHMANDWAPAAIWLLAPAVALAMDLTPAEVGLLITIHSVGAALAYLAAGLLADRVSARGGLLVATFWWVAVGYMIASFATGFWTLAILLAVAGMGDAAWHPIATGVLTQNSPKRRAHVLGLHAIGGTMAEVLAPLSAGFLLAWFDWQQVLQISVLPAVLAGIAFFWIRRHVPRSSATAISLGDVAALWRIWRSLRGVKLLALISFYNMALIAILSMAPLYLQTVHGLSAGVTGAVFAAMLLVGALLQPYIGLVSDVVGRRVVFLTGNLLAALAAGAIVFLGDVYVIIALLIVSASALVGVRSAGLAATVDFVGQREATTLGLAFALMDGVGALGGALAGLAASVSLAYAFVVAAVLASGSVLVGLTMPLQAAEVVRERSD